MSLLPAASFTHAVNSSDDTRAEQLAVAIDALADGIARQKLADPDAVPDELMGRVLSLLFAGATRPAGTGTRSAP